MSAPASAAPPQARPLSRRDGALAGLAAGLLALGAAEMVAALTGPSSEPVVAVGDAFVDLTPPWLKEFATSTFGTSDKLVLLVGAVLVVAALCALAGVIAARGRFRGPWLILGLGTVAAIAAVTRPDATILSVLPSAVAAVVGALVLSALIDRLETASRPDLGSGPGPDRRAVLRTVGVVAGSGAVALVAGRLLGSSTRNAEASRASVRLPAPASPEPPLPAGVEVGVPGVVPFRVPNRGLLPDRHRARRCRSVADGDWSCASTGWSTARSRSSYADLLARPLVERDVTLTCVSNEVGGDLIGNARGSACRSPTAAPRPASQPGADMVLVDQSRTASPPARRSPS